MTDTLKAAFWMLGAIASFTSMAVAGRAISVELDTFEIMLYRSLAGIVFVLTVATLAGTRGQIRVDRLGLHLLRNLSHFSGQNLWFFSLTQISLAQLFALEFTGPIWAILLAPLILQERVTAIGLVSALIGFAGVLIVTRPGATPIETGTITAGLAAIGFALSALFTRRLTRSETITCILFWLTAMQAALGLICAGIDGQIALPSASGLPWVVLIACAGLIAHFCLTTALSIAPASVVMPLDFARLPLIAIVGAIFYQEPLDPIVFLGAALIFAAIYLNVTRGGTVRAAGARM